MDILSTAHLSALLDHGQGSLLAGGLKGLEKESLRITKDGRIAQTPHPAALGSALTHPHITTDYSEALIEFITPAYENFSATLAFMRDIHQFFYAHCGDEMLLASSMPCGIDGDLSVPIAEYGASNIGQMKHAYRRGLWYRYGRSMQAIAGVHFNYSIPERLWLELHRQTQSQLALADFINAGYFQLIRNFQRLGWITLYLFGASPAISQRFFTDRPQLADQFERFDAQTLYHPFATSLRMSDIGYKSKNQAGLSIDFNGLDGYVASLKRAITTPYPDYEAIGIKVDGEYRQLNANILQIENEFYGTIRPKQIANSCEKPTLALQRRGVRYVEIRSLDLNLLYAVGIGEDAGRFLETLLLACLFQASPASGTASRDTNNSNQLAVANMGRKPGLVLSDDGKTIPLQTWAHEIFASLQPIAAALDGGQSERPYQQTLAHLAAYLDDPDMTPSAQMLKAIAETQASFENYAVAVSARHRDEFNGKPFSAERNAYFEALGEQSHQKQHQIEANDSVSFDTFLQNYFAQLDP